MWREKGLEAMTAQVDNIYGSSLLSKSDFTNRMYIDFSMRSGRSQAASVPLGS